MAHFHRVVRVRTVQYTTIRDGTHWSSLRFHRQLYPCLICMMYASKLLYSWTLGGVQLRSDPVLTLFTLFVSFVLFFQICFLNRSRHQMRITLAEKSILFLSACISHHYVYYSASRHLNLGTIAGQTKKTLSPILGLGGISSLYDISISRSADILRLPPERLPRTTVRGSVREEKCLLCLKSQTYHRLFFIFGWTNPLTGCTTIWVDRDERSLFKSIGGGLRVFVHNSWATQYCIGGKNARRILRF